MQTTTNPQIMRRTALQQARMQRNKAIYKEYTELIAIEGQSRMRICEYIMKKYGLYSRGTFYGIIKKMKKDAKRAKGGEG